MRGGGFPITPLIYTVPNETIDGIAIDGNAGFWPEVVVTADTVPPQYLRRWTSLAMA